MSEYFSLSISYPYLFDVHMEFILGHFEWQVPLSLAVKVTLLRGTVRIHIKPPPSDQVWIAFTTMPHIEWDLDSHVGDHRVAAGAQIGSFIGNRIKVIVNIEKNIIHHFVGFFFIVHVNASR